MSEETTYRFLTEEEQERFHITMLQAITACKYQVTETWQLEKAICNEFALENIEDIRRDQLAEVTRWIITIWLHEEMELHLESLYNRQTEFLKEVQTAYLIANRQRTLLSTFFKRGLLISLFVLVSFVSLASAQTIQVQPTGVDFTNARTLTTTLTEDEVQSWIQEYPAASPYSFLILNVEKTTYLDYPAENVIATLATGEALISAKMNDSKGIKLFRDGQLQNLATPSPTTIPLGSFSPLPAGIEDDCFYCLQSCDQFARNTRAADENIAVAAMGVAALGCTAMMATNPSLGFVCAAAALTKFYADVNSAKQKYIQAIWQCGMTCKRPNGTICRGRDR